ncbi:endonuclease/exonuclease/phosphatase family protein [Sinisalibacter aestuarii]|nr:endonuclease/exonuclease/phosphatase family protein [Sinisalibacter aestuarii]
MMHHALRLRPAFLVFQTLALALLVLLPPPAWAQGYTYTHYQKNMAFRNDEERALAGDILARAPDAVTLQEVNRDNDKLLAMLAQAYPSQEFCTFKGIGGVAVLSRWPLVPGSNQCIRPLGAVAIQVQMPQGRVWVISVHLETRDKPRHARQAQRLGAYLSQVPGPKIIGGDFNNAPQSGPVRDVANGAGVNRIGAAITTRRVGGLLGVPIDFVFASGGRGEVTQLPLLGSDHYGVWAEFTMAD